MTLEQKLFITLNLEFDNILLIRDLQFPSMQKTIPKKKGIQFEQSTHFFGNHWHPA